MQPKHQFKVLRGGRTLQPRPAQPVDSLPLLPVRRSIRDAYVDGQSEHDIARNLGIGVGVVRLVLRGWQQLAERQAALLKLQATSWELEGCLSLERQIWEELADTFPVIGRAA